MVAFIHIIGVLVFDCWLMAYFESQSK